jgi:hypothetical protein
MFHEMTKKILDNHSNPTWTETKGKGNDSISDIIDDRIDYHRMEYDKAHKGEHLICIKELQALKKKLGL